MINEDLKNFSIKINKFDGPLDLLLELIQKKKYLINDVSLSEISENYIFFVRENEFSLAEATSFLSVAATLMLIKSRSLLPKVIFEKEDESNIDDLKKRLKILQEFKILSEKVQNIFGKNILHQKIFRRKKEIKFRPDASITSENILLSLDNLISTIKTTEKLREEKVQKILSLKEITEKVYDKVRKYLKISFLEVIVSDNKKDIAVSFLAILELFRNGQVDLLQDKAFGKIQIEKSEPDLIYREK